MKNNTLIKILEHPDKDEIISKILIGISPEDINEWLSIKYSAVSEAKFVLPIKTIKNFKDNYADVYDHIKQDILKSVQNKNLSPGEQLELSVKGNKYYKQKMMNLVDNEIDIKKTITNMIIAIESRAAQVFDKIQEDPENVKTDRILIEWFDTLGATLEKYHKIVNQAPDQIIQHNVALQAVDQHILVFYQALKEVLADMDVEASLKFMDIFNQKMSKLSFQEEKLLPTETRLVQATMISENINKKLSES